MTMYHVRTGHGKPLLLVHGLGGSNRSWDPILPALAQAREVITLDLPGHGQTREEVDSGTFDGLARSLDDWLICEGLKGIDMVGSSMGARLVLEMARRGRAGAVVALNPRWVLGRVGTDLLQDHNRRINPTGANAEAGNSCHYQKYCWPDRAYGSAIRQALGAGSRRDSAGARFICEHADFRRSCERSRQRSRAERPIDDICSSCDRLAEDAEAKVVESVQGELQLADDDGDGAAEKRAMDQAQAPSVVARGFGLNESSARERDLMPGVGR